MLRQGLTLNGYQYWLEYHLGIELGNADGLSQLPLLGGPVRDVVAGRLFMLEKAFPSLLSAVAMQQATNRDPVLSTVRQALWTGKRLPDAAEWRPFSSRMEECSVEDSCVPWGCRVVPTSLRPALLNVLHDTHPGIEKMKMIDCTEPCLAARH